MSSTRIAKAAAGSTGSWVVVAVATLAYVSVTSRIYSPSVVAGYTVGLSALSIGGILLGSGITLNLLRTPDLGLVDEARHVGWSIIAGLILGLLMFAFAGQWASLWGVPDGADFTRFLAIAAVTTPLSNLTLAQLRRSGMHARASTVNAAATVAAAVAGGAAALVFGSPIALAGSNVLVPWLLVVGSGIAGARLRPRLSRSLINSRYVAGAVAYNTMNYLSYNLVPWAIARTVTPSTLGLFSRAYTMASMPSQGIAGAISAALFPEYRTVDESERASVTTGALVVSAGIVTLMLGLMSSLGTPEVTLFLGDKWLETIPLFIGLTLALVPLVPQWTLSIAGQSINGFGSQRASRSVILLGGILGGGAVALTGNAYIGIAGIGMMHAAGHTVDVYRSSRSGMIDIQSLLPCYLRIAAATVPLFGLGLLQATGVWSILSGSDYLLLALGTCISTAVAASVMLSGATRRVIDDLGLLPTRRK